MSKDVFIPYPEIDDNDFYDKIFWKKEFQKTRTGPDSHFYTTDDICKKSEFKIQNHQAFVRNLISPETPYNGVLLFYGTGVGKTCASVGISEGLRDYVKKNDKKIYILTPNSYIQSNFRNELFNGLRDQLEKKSNSVPGSFQCAGDRYYISERDESRPLRRLAKIKKIYEDYYTFWGLYTFANRVAELEKKGIDIGDYFMNSVIIIDEAHQIAGKEKMEFRDPSTKKHGKSKSTKVSESATALEMETEYDEDAEYDEDESMPTTIVATRKDKLNAQTPIATLNLVISRCREKGGSIKLILLTATPMKDNQSELADILEVLTRNDDRKIDGFPFDRKKLFPSGVDGDIDEGYLQKAAKGYISYVRGNNPASFPRAILPPIEYLYEPNMRSQSGWNPLYTFSGKDVKPEGSPYKHILHAEEGHEIYYNFNLVKCPMSIYQFKITQALRTQSSENEEQFTAGVPGVQASNFVFPIDGIDKILGETSVMDVVNKPGVRSWQITATMPDGNKTVTVVERTTSITKPTITAEYEVNNPTHTEVKISLVNMLKNTYGPAGFKNFFISEKETADGESTHIQYSVNPRYSKYNDILLDDETAPYHLGMVSAKFRNFLRYVNTSAGIVFAYSNFEAAGALIGALVLEANGYIRYNINLRFNNTSGLPNNDSMSNLLKNRPATFRCVCGSMYTDHVNRFCPTGISKFKQATYTILTGNFNTDKNIDYVKTPDNIRGGKVKVVIATAVAGTGVDFSWVRQVYILDPWWNNTRIYQTIGRGIRYCSHADLDENERTVEIYKCASTIPEEFENLSAEEINEKYGVEEKELYMETVDEAIYNTTVSKDIKGKKIERLLKQISIDCEQNKYLNYFGELDTCPEKETTGTCDYSRICDYTKCAYECLLYKDKIQYMFVDYRKTKDGKYLISTSKDSGDALESVEHLECDEVAVSQIFSLLQIDEPTDNKLEPCEYLWNMLSKKINKINKVEATDEHGGYQQIRIDIPLHGTVDNSTYNIYFSKPQIDKARLYITRLYKKNVALTIGQIVNLLTRLDPLLEKEFIYTAMDLLVGNPPYIIPHKVYDKFNRTGYIIFRHNYYIFQPVEVEDQRIPVRYRTLPITKKHKEVILSKATTSEIIKQTTKSENIAGTSNSLIDKYIKKIETLPVHQPDPKNLQFVDLMNIKISFYQELARLLFSEWHELMISTGPFLIDKKNRGMHILSRFIFEYLYRMNLIVIVAADQSTALIDFNDYIDQYVEYRQNKNSKSLVIFYSIIKPSTVYEYKQDKWEKKSGELPSLEHNTTLQEAINSGTDTNIFLSSWVSDRNKITHPSRLPVMGDNIIVGLYWVASKKKYEYINPLSHRIQLSQLGMTASQYIQSKVVDLSKVTEGWKADKTYGKRGMKILDNTKIVDTVTQQGVRSTRRDPSGKMCNTGTLDERKNAFDILYSFFTEDNMVFDDSDELRYFSAEQFTYLMTIIPADNSTLQSSCVTIEYLLILLDYMQFMSRRWYLNTFETYYYQK